MASPGAKASLTAPSFGAVLRRLRVAAGLTQEALAERSGVSVRGISDLERGVKSRPHAETVRLLAEGLSLGPAERAALLAAARPPRPPAPAAPDLAALPVPPTSLVGRAADVARVQALFGRPGTRLLTLTGPGGVGKTRLALAAAAELRPAVTGVAFVSLAGLAAPELVPEAIAHALGVREVGGRPLLEVLRDRLGGRRDLLVLDNFEHLPAAAPFVADLLAACPGLLILATSRVPLRLSAEQLVPVRPLPLPEPTAPPSLADLARVPAIALFVQRARAALPDFALTEANAADVADICAGLDGLPLAIELAAARIRTLSPAMLRDLLSNRLRLLDHGPIDAPARQQTLRAAIAWSDDLLAPEGQARFRRVAVFAGGCTLEAAATVANGDSFAALEEIGALVDASLLDRREWEDGTSWYAMLDTVRAYALERLAACGEREALQRAHAAYYLTLAEQAELELAGPRQVAWMARLRAEEDNLRAALGWAIAHADAEAALRLGAALWPFWAANGRLGEGRSWLERAVALGGAIAPAARAKALLRLGNLAVDLADYRKAHDLYQASLTIRRSLGDEVGAAGALVGLGLVAWNQGDFASARSALEAAMGVWRAHANQRGMAMTLMDLGYVALAEANYGEARRSLDAALGIRRETQDAGGIAYVSFALGRLARLEGEGAKARTYLEQSLTIFRQIDERLGVAFALNELGSVAHGEGDDGSALALHREALRLRRRVGDGQGIVACLEGIAVVMCAQGRAAQAVTLLGTAAGWRAAHGTPLSPPLRAEIDHALTEASLALGQPAFARAWEEGQGMTLEPAATIAGSDPA